MNYLHIMLSKDDEIYQNVTHATFFSYQKMQQISSHPLNFATIYLSSLPKGEIKVM